MIVLKLLLFSSAAALLQVAIKITPRTANPITGERCPESDVMFNCTVRQTDASNSYNALRWNINRTDMKVVEYAYNPSLAETNYSYFPLVVASAARFRCLQVSITSARNSSGGIELTSTLVTDYSTVLRLRVDELKCTAIASRLGGAFSSRVFIRYTIRGKYVYYWFSHLFLCA